MTTSWPITCTLAMTHAVLLHTHSITHRDQMVYKVCGGCRNHWLFCATAVLCDFLCIRQVEQNLSLILWRQMLAFCGFLQMPTVAETVAHVLPCRCSMQTASRKSQNNLASKLLCPSSCRQARKHFLNISCHYTWHVPSCFSSLLSPAF